MSLKIGERTYSLGRKIPKNKKTHDQFMTEVNEKYGENHEYEFITEYNGCDKDLIVRHNNPNCKHEWKTRPDKFLNPRNKKGEPCPKCSPDNPEKIFIEKVNKLFNKEYVVIESYINNNTSLKVKHKCGYAFSVTPKKFLNNEEECPLCKCSLNLDKIDGTIIDFVKRVYAKEGDNYTVICEFKGFEVIYRLKHLYCGTEVEITPEQFLNNEYICKDMRCSDKTNKYNFKEKVFTRYGDEYVVIDEYINARTKINFKHNVEHCGRVFQSRPEAVLRGKGLCPTCRNGSRAEQKIEARLIQKNQIFKREFSFDDCRANNLLRFDFAIFTKSGKLAYLIEYDGQQHFEPVNFGGCSDEEALLSHEQTKKNDLIKNKYCKDNNINLVRIPYWESKNINSIIDNVIKNNVRVDKSTFLIKI